MRVFLLSLLIAPLLWSQSESEAEVRRIVEIFHKQQRGEAATAEETESVKRIQARRRGAPEAFLQANPPRDSTGLVPLTDLGGGEYKGERGGLYPGGSNAPSPAYLQAGRKAAAAIAPLDGEGKHAADGKIALLSLGMSNTTQSFQVFQKLAAADTHLNPRLVIVDGAQGANSAEVTANPASGFWLVVDERLKKAGVTPRQVQAVWMKQAFQMPTRPFPTEAKVLHQYLVENVGIMRRRFPNLKIVYLSSRTYAGWARSPLNPEPHAYEGAFSVKWLIADRIAGRLDGPWLAWGPYLWADGVKGRADGFAYAAEDFAADGTHPSPAGREKVARLLLDFLKSDPTARPWFVKTD